MALKTYTKGAPDPLLLFADDFAEGPCGWCGLINGSNAQGVVLPSTMPTSGKAALRLSIEDGGSSYNPDAYAMAVKRFGVPYDPKTGAVRRYVTWEMDLALKSYWNIQQRWSSPRTIDIGIDYGWGAQADGTDNRSFIGLRYQIVDEAAGNAPTQKFQLKTTPDHGATTAFTDLLDKAGNPITFPLGYNENKANVFRLRGMSDLIDHRLVGLSINGKGYGMLDESDLSSTAQNCLYNAGQAWTAPLNQGSAASFYGGFNLCVEIYSRTNVGTTAADLYITDVRMEALI